MLLNKFHPRQLAIVGYSGSGKTTLIEKLLFHFRKQQLLVGIIKHDTHHLNLDKEGKDSYRFWQAGATAVVAHNQHEQFSRIKASYNLREEYFQSCDFLLVEGHKHSEFPKIVFLDENMSLWHDFDDDKKKTAIAFIGTLNKCPIKTERPYFQRDAVQEIAHFILDYFKQQTASIALKGLIVAGGHSSRMGQDKSKLNYHGLAQYKWAYNLLKNAELDAYISCRPDQNFDLPIIKDTVLGQGPLGGILSALQAYPNTAFLTIAVDQPNLTLETVQHLIHQRNSFRHASAYTDQEQLEPLCCVYEPSFKAIGFNALGKDECSPKRILENAHTQRIPVPRPDDLANSNTQQDYHQLQQLIASPHET